MSVKANRIYRICLSICLSLLMMTAMGVPIQEDKDTLVVDSFLPTLTFAQPQWQHPDSIKKPSFLKKVGRTIGKFFKEFTAIDTTYIEPQRFDYTIMLQNTNSYEVYRVNTESGQRYTFAPEPSIRIGPYFGWRWAFFGYTLDVKHIHVSHDKTTNKQYDMSLYTSMLGFDFYYRDVGDDFKLRDIDLGPGIDASRLKGLEFKGVKSTVKGINMYYVFNHRKFSYPAAFAQSTVQRRSAGTPIAGISYTRHKLSVDFERLDQFLKEHLPDIDVPIDSALRFGTIKYIDVAMTGGYAYNWVFAKNWLLSTSLSVGLGYKRSSGDLKERGFSFRNFSFNNLNIDGIGRMGIVYNNTRWFAGISGILHVYNYRKNTFSTNNIFGSVNIYFGVNVGRKKAYRWMGKKK